MHALRCGFAAVSLLVSWSVNAASALPGPVFPSFKNAAALEAYCGRGLGRARASLNRLEEHRADGNWTAAYDDLNALIEDWAGPVYLLSNVHPDPALRQAAEACELRWQDFSSSLGQNEKLYLAASRLRPRDPVDALLLKTLREDFEDAGVSLPPDKRRRAKEINDRLNALQQEFERNVRDANVRVPLAPEALRGVPEATWRDAKRDDQGHVLLGVDTPTYLSVMQSAADATTRERMWRAKTDEGGAPNLKLLDEIVQLRKEYAGLFDSPSYADFTLRRRMVQNGREAKRFLDEVLSAVAARERSELDELRDAKARDLGQPLQQVTLQRWDLVYYQEQVRRARFSVDQEAFRQYFPPRESLALVMRVIEKMMGVKYTRVPGVPLWHSEAQAYAVRDAKTGRALATLYVDLFARDGKFNHAAVWSFRNGSLRTQRAPQAALVVNIGRNGLTLEDLETLLHEFGHAVHNNLSATRYSAQAGTTVLRDFVEAPSQMLEEWVYDPRVLKVMREVCAQCPPVPDALVAQAQAAKRQGKGSWYARQWLYASYDLALHGPDAPEPMATWARMEGATPMGHVAGSMFPAGFAHLAGGYGAGYYGYLWSEVLAADLRTAFAADRLSPVVGARYRRTVLANGSQVLPQELLREFLGRDSNTKAFFEDLKR
jgi:thimet oligopeptidase